MKTNGDPNNKVQIWGHNANHIKSLVNIYLLVAETPLDAMAPFSAQLHTFTFQKHQHYEDCGGNPDIENIFIHIILNLCKVTIYRF